MNSMYRLNKVIRVAGMKRNGNHGIVNWILCQHRGRATFRNAAIYYNKLGNLKSDPIEAFRHTEGLEKVDLDTPGDKELFLFTYEDHPVENALNPESANLYESWMGHEIGRSIDVLILRDPFNFFASRIQGELNGVYPLKSWGDCFSQGNSAKLWSKWKAYATAFLDFEANPSNDRIPTSYNHWVTSLDYRRDLCRKLSVELENDEARKTVTGWGAGSSFDKGVWQEPPTYLNRWKRFQTHPVLIEAAKDEELIALTRSIFGDVMDVDAVLSSLK